MRGSTSGICPSCAAEFVGMRTKRYCSDLCRDRQKFARRAGRVWIADRTCPYCGRKGRSVALHVRACVKNPAFAAIIRERVLSRVDRSGPNCWLWTGDVDQDGYGKASVGNGRTLGAHRVVYELLVGPVPDGLELDHLCRVRRCCKPEHLEPVTHVENVRRGLLGGLRAA